jgi:hypothetical protein
MVESERAKLGTGVRFSPAALGVCNVPIFARWSRQPVSQTGNAGSNPAGDAGPICRPVVHFGGPRLGDRACQRSSTAAPSRAASCPCSRGTRLKHTKLEAQVRLLAGAPQEGTVPSEAHNLGAVGSIPAPASRGASRRAAALIRLSLEVRFLPSRLIWVWLNLAEHRFRAPAIGGSNPPTQTILAVHSLGVAQSGRAPVRGTGDWGFESLHPDLWISRSGLDGTVT